MLPGASPACTTTITASAKRADLQSGVTCIAGATIDGPVTSSRARSSLRRLAAPPRAHAVDARRARLRSVGEQEHEHLRTTGDLIIAGSEFHKLVVNGNKGSSYGVAIVGNRIADKLLCNDNDPGVTDFGAPNDVGRKATGDCAGL